MRSSRTRLAVEPLEDRLVPSSVLTPDQAFVNQVYQDLLGQPADPQSLATWSARAQQGVPLPVVVLLIEKTPAYLSVQVDQAYHTFLHRDPGAGEMLFGEALLSQGGTELQLDALLAGGSEYYLKNGGTNIGFLKGFYRDALGVTNVSNAVYGTAISEWLGVMDTGVSPAEVAYTILSGGQYLTQQIDDSLDNFGLSGSDDLVQDLLPVAVTSNGLDLVNALLLGSPESFALAQTHNVPLVTVAPGQAAPTSTAVTEFGSSFSGPLGGGPISLQARVSNLTGGPNPSGTVTFTFTPTHGGSAVSVSASVGSGGLAATQVTTLTGQDYTLLIQFTPANSGVFTASNATYSVTFSDGDETTHTEDIQDPDSTKTTFDDGNDQLVLNH